MLTVVREVQIPLLAALLTCGSLTKAWFTVRPGRAALTNWQASFPLGARRPAALALSVVEFALGVGLLLTAGPVGAGRPASVVRIAVALLFGTAAGALYVLQGRHPDLGCGCFGDLSRTPVGWRVITRAVLMCLAALSVLGAPPLHMPDSAARAWLMMAVAAVGVAVLCVLSPETGELMRRLSHTEPCEVRTVPVTRTLAALRASAQWRRYQRFIVADKPSDVWREGCWRFVVYPAVLASRRTDVVFAVHLASRSGPDRVRVGMLDTGADFELPQQAAEPQLLFSKLV
jgi:hypothetical protein